VTNYWENVKEALKEMHRQVGDLKLSKRGIAESGLLIRHLVLPNKLSGTEKVLSFISEEISVNTYVNIMDQYHPAYKSNEYNELSRFITKKEYGEAVDFAKKLGLTRGLEI
jgi:putative pyruvate formate lyase activating enzyme